MSEAVQGYRPRQFTIKSLEGKTIDITNSVMSIDYYEDILSPSIYVTAQCVNKYSIVSGLPIRGGEEVDTHKLAADEKTSSLRPIISW